VYNFRILKCQVDRTRRPRTRLCPMRTAAASTSEYLMPGALNSEILMQTEPPGWKFSAFQSERNPQDDVAAPDVAMEGYRLLATWLSVRPIRPCWI
jgi:hypothetical protein